MEIGRGYHSLREWGYAQGALTLPPPCGGVVGYAPGNWRVAPKENAMSVDFDKLAKRAREVEKKLRRGETVPGEERYNRQALIEKQLEEHAWRSKRVAAGKRKQKWRRARLEREMARHGLVKRFLTKEKKLPPGVGMWAVLEAVASKDPEWIAFRTIYTLSGVYEKTAVGLLNRLASYGWLEKADITPEVLEAHMATRIKARQGHQPKPKFMYRMTDAGWDALAVLRRRVRPYVEQVLEHMPEEG